MVSTGHTSNKCQCRGDNAITIIVAAGKGLRFGSELPKQFLDLSGKVVLMRTIDAFRDALPGCHIILVLSEDGRTIWEEICASHDYESPEIVLGGASRSDSVANALSAIPDEADKVVMVHDGARPLVSAKLIRDMYAAIAELGYDAAVPSTLPTDAICTISGPALLPVDRENYRNVQTPQSFRLDVLKTAYSRRTPDVVVADDASMVSKFTSSKIMPVEGDKTNIKITSPTDLDIAAVFLRRR